MKTAWLFPGQGSQKIGMGKDLLLNTNIGKRYYKIANDILGIDIQSISFNGPEEILKKTKYTQPAIFIVSTIIGHLIMKNGHTCDGVAGHSLGEYSALVIAGGINFELGLELVKIRSESMYDAGKKYPGTMAAIIGMDINEVKNLCDLNNNIGVIVAANHNTKNQIVVSGNIDAVNSLINDAKNFGARMTVPLNVSGAFHSPLMNSARQVLANKLDSINISDISIPLYSNVNAKPLTKGKEIKNSLIQQLEKPVLWYDTIQNMIKDKYSNFIEIGPGNILQGLNRKINRSPSISGIQSYEDILSHEI